MYHLFNIECKIKIKDICNERYLIIQSMLFKFQIKMFSQIDFNKPVFIKDMHIYPHIAINKLNIMITVNILIIWDLGALYHKDAMKLAQE